MKLTAHFYQMARLIHGTSPPFTHGPSWHGTYTQKEFTDCKYACSNIISGFVD
jgi:hypothetical protein